MSEKRIGKYEHFAYSMQVVNGFPHMHDAIEPENVNAIPIAVQLRNTISDHSNDGHKL
jgi:hypothetical protein